MEERPLSTLLDGQALARTIRRDVRGRALAMVSHGHRAPHLAAVLIGDDAASATYVGMKGRACDRAGIRSSVRFLPPSASQPEAEDLIARLNADDDVDGILVQHPTPPHLDEQAILDIVSPNKDVDGLSTVSLGRLVAGQSGFRACTPLGIMALLDHYRIDCTGREAVVVGRSTILGKPMALLLLERHATVTVCHSRTSDLGSVTRRADILVVGVGRAELVTGAMVKPGAVVVDAGYNKAPGRSCDVGDVEWATAEPVASHITPVPGGVGPMTIAVLLRNTLAAAEARRPISPP